MFLKLLLFATYIIFLTLIVIFSYSFIDPNLGYLKDIYTGFAFQNRQLTTVLFVFFLLCFFVYYILFLKFFNKKQLSQKEIKTLICATVGVLIFAYPAMLSYDIFNYIATAKVLFLYKENPYIMMPIDFLHEPLLAFMHAANKTALYGPSWLLLSGIPFIIGAGNFILTLFSFKLFIVIFFLATIFLILRITNNMFSVILFSLNPLVVFETIVSSHNDIVMVFFALLSYYLLSKKRVWLAIVFFLISVFIKFATLFILPIFLYAVWKSINKQKVYWDKIYYYSSVAMYVIFFLSPLREEIYPWYAIWFLVLAFLIPEKKLLLLISIIFSFSLLLRYIPFMLTGNYFGFTPLAKILLTFVPIIIGLGIVLLHKSWRKVCFR